MGKVLEGAAWFATLSLATLGTLTFAPDEAWETFPTALRPVRAKLADFGVAPSCYRVEDEAETAAEKESVGLLAKRENETKSGATADESDWSVGTRVRVGGERRVRQIAETSAESELNGASAGGFGEIGAGFDDLAAGENAERFGAFADVERLETAVGSRWGSGGDSLAESGIAAASDGGEMGSGVALGEVAEYSDADAIPPFVAEQNGRSDAAPTGETDPLAVADSTGFDNLNIGASFPVSGNVDAGAANSEGGVGDGSSDFNASASSGKTPISNANPTPNAGFAPLDENGTSTAGGP
ncbi:MAG: hypothetical protein IKU86_13030, partial [Thermoguttaceae bacterium]|nr:hypothetical protein [Thermoguttaceae bacterium]